MKLRIAIFFALIALFILVSVAWASSGAPGSGALYTLQPAALTGGSYLLASPPCQVVGAAAGERYRLVELAAPGLAGNGCCCTYLPITMH